jgi:adenylate cyclase
VVKEIIADPSRLQLGGTKRRMSDAIIAFFGAPIPLEDHALRACVAALTMKRIEKELNKKIMEEKLSPKPLFTRIGINTGDMVAGNMGTGNKMNYTIMGIPINRERRTFGDIP